MLYRVEPTTTALNIDPFDELILSWNGVRPKTPWIFWISLYQEGWSSWMRLAEWGEGIQRTFSDSCETAKTYQDIASPKSGLCTGFRVKVEGDLAGLHSLFVCCSNLKEIQTKILNLPPVHLNEFPAQSQQILSHKRARDLCSPTSTTTSINYLLKQQLCPAQFAETAKDQGFDIYGNWVLNTAAASEYLLPKYRIHVERLTDFSAIHNQLQKGLPTVVSVRGPLPGAPMPYQYGHLLCVIGYENGRVHCMDPGFPTSDQTHVSYPLSDFLDAWTSRRKNLAYVISKTA